MSSQFQPGPGNEFLPAANMRTCFFFYGLHGFKFKSVTSHRSIDKSRTRFQLSDSSEKPERTATAGVYLFLGPIEAEIHRKQSSLLHAIMDSDNRKNTDLCEREISVNFDNKRRQFLPSHLENLGVI